MHPDAANGGIDVNKLVPGRLIPAGAWIQNLGITGRGEPVKMFLGELLRLFEIAEVPKSWYAAADALKTEKAIIEITYSSVYGDRWRLRSDRFVPERL